MIPTRPGSSLGGRRRSISGNAPSSAGLSGRISFGTSGENTSSRTSVTAAGAGGRASIGGNTIGTGIPRASIQSRVRRPSLRGEICTGVDCSLLC